MATLSAMNLIAPSDAQHGVRINLFTANSTAAAIGTMNLEPSATNIPVTDIKVSISGLTTETIALTQSYDGTNFSAAFKPIDNSTGNLTASTNLGNGTYLVRCDTGTINNLKFTKSSTVERAFVAATHATFPGD